MRDLRRLVVGGEERLVADALPRAVAIRTRRDRQLAHALAPLVAETVGEVARNDPEKLAAALQPMVGHAVRKAVAAAFAALIERVNQALEHTLSVRSVQWRIEALRTGRPFAEVVLVHSLVYRVDEIFLVHRRTGLLLAHAAADPNAGRAPDQVAAMLSAIERFVHDAFRGGDALTRFQVGDLQGRVEVGAEAAITAVVRGTPPESLQRVLRDALERVHVDCADALLSFRGDASPFEVTRPILEDCLLEKLRTPRRPALLRVLVGLVVLVVAALVVFAALSARAANRKLSAHADALRALPGVVVSTASRDGARMSFTGLRDPLAPDPRSVLLARGVDGSKLTTHFEPFLSTDARLVEPRVRTALSTPDTVGLTNDGGRVTARGTAPREWLTRARLAGTLLPAVASLDVSGVAEREAVDAARKAGSRIEDARVSFEHASSAIEGSQRATLDAIAADAAQLRINAPGARAKVQIVVDGHADATGGVLGNLELSRSRAHAVTQALIERGVEASWLTVRASGAEPAERTATFHVVLEGLP